ncbi:hypothetical protein [uncultured Brevibacterium sp.]|uniref:hypothetical protein n=1 Tax=uncultured Brevibacterium sp. TaxID=189678 RepID=UPI0025DF4BCF|nr:hypothetical protein [uncultured Brevibacterium sp.]
MKTVILVLLMFAVVLTPAIIWMIVTVRTASRRGKPDPQLRQQLLTAPQGMATILERRLTVYQAFGGTIARGTRRLCTFTVVVRTPDGSTFHSYAEALIDFTAWNQNELAEGQVHPVKYLPHDTSRVWFVEKLSQN